MTGLDSIGTLHTALSSLNVNEAAPAAGVQQKTGAETSATLAGTGDRASLSAAGELASQAADTSDVRLTKVAELRQSIESGTYNVPASAVADKMIDSLLG